MSKTISIKRSNKKLYKSSSLPRYDVKDFRAANKYIKQQKLYNNDPESNSFYRFAKNGSQSSFMSGLAKNTTLDTAAVGKSLLSRMSLNTSNLMKSSSLTYDKN